MGLGTSVVGAKTWQDAASKSGLDFILADEPLRTDFEIIRSHKAIVRQDTGKAIAIVGSGFETIQPLRAFEFLDVIAGENAHYLSAGVRKGGANMYVEMRIPSADISVGGDISHTSLLFAQGFDGTMAVWAKMISRRLTCDNQILRMLHAGDGASMRIAHRIGANERLQDANALLIGSLQDARMLEATLRSLANRPLTRERMTSILDRLFPVTEGAQTRREKTLATILDIFESNDGNAFPEQRGTAYNLLNAVTNYTDHVRGTRSTDTMDTLARRKDSAVFGTGEKLKQRALEIIEVLTDGTERARIVYQDVPSKSVLGSILNN